MTNYKEDIPCREKITINGLIEKCENEIKESAGIEVFEKGRQCALKNMRVYLKYLKEDMESSND